MRQRYRTFGKWTLRGFISLVLLGALYIATLAVPYPLFSHTDRFGEFTVYSNQPLPADFENTVGEARERVAGMDHTQPDAEYRVFICDDERLYSLFTTLTRRSSNSMALGLAVFGNIFINEPKVTRVATLNHAGIRHSRFEGDLAEVIAHEIAHFNVMDRLGFRSAVRLAEWKSEGYAEYQANLAPSRADNSYDLADRVGILLDDSIWGYGESYGRRLFAWHVLVEFLAEVKGLDLIELVDERVTEAYAREELLAWYEEQRSAG